MNFPIVSNRFCVGVCFEHVADGGDKVLIISFRTYFGIHCNRDKSNGQDCYQRWWHCLGHLGKKPDDRHGQHNESQHHGQRCAGDHLELAACLIKRAKTAKLRETNDNRKPVHKSQHNGMRYQTDQFSEPQEADNQLDQTTQNDCGEQVLDPVHRHECNDNDSHRSCCTRNHARASAQQSSDQSDKESRIQADDRGNSGHEGKRDRLRHKRQRHGDTGKNVILGGRRPRPKKLKHIVKRRV